jgi:hypothetical protein
MAPAHSRPTESRTGLWRGLLALALMAGSASVVEPAAAAEPVPQSVTVYLVYNGPEAGRKEQYKACDALQVQVAAALGKSGAGEYAGTGTSGGDYMMYLSGPSADAIFKAVEPVLRKSALSKGGKVALRYGREGAREVEKSL